MQKPGPLIPPVQAKPGPLIPPPPTKPKLQTRRRSSSKATRSKCTGSRKTCRRRELRRRATEKRRRQEKAKEKIAASSTSQSVEEASDSSYLSTNSGYNEYREYMAQGKLKDEELGELREEIEELELAGAYEEAAMKRKNLQGIISKITDMDRQFKQNDEPIMKLSTA